MTALLKTQNPCPCTDNACIDEMMAYTYFLPGTWWVYEEQNSGDRDSVYVYEASSSIGSDGSHHFLMRTHSTYDEYNYYYQFTESLTMNPDYPSCASHHVYRTKTKPGDFVGYDLAFFFPMFLNDSRYVWGGGLSSIDTLWVNEYGTAEEVYFDIDNCNSEGYEYAGFHLSKNLGIERKSLYDRDEYWLLIEHNIVQ